jgi:hypothetical protein
VLVATIFVVHQPFYPRRVAVTYWIVCLRLPDLRSTYNLLIVATAGVLLRSVCPYYYTVPAAAAAACLLAAATNAVLALLTYLLVPNFPPLPSSASHLLPLLFTLHWFYIFLHNSSLFTLLRLWELGSLFILENLLSHPPPALNTLPPLSNVCFSWRVRYLAVSFSGSLPTPRVRRTAISVNPRNAQLPDALTPVWRPQEAPFRTSFSLPIAPTYTPSSLQREFPICLLVPTRHLGFGFRRHQPVGRAHLLYILLRRCRNGRHGYSRRRCSECLVPIHPLALSRCRPARPVPLRLSLVVSPAPCSRTFSGLHFRRLDGQEGLKRSVSRASQGRLREIWYVLPLPRSPYLRDAV